LLDQIEGIAKLKDDIYSAALSNNSEIPPAYHTLYSKITTILDCKVKNGALEPIMNAAKFKKMIRDLNLMDLQSDDDICKATHFLHEAGVLLHYDDCYCNLNDLYFVDPSWFCDIMSTIITAQTTLM